MQRETKAEGSTRVIRALHSLLGDAVPIIGVGGILAGEHAREKIDAGAQLVQPTRAARRRAAPPSNGVGTGMARNLATMDLCPELDDEWH